MTDLDPGRGKARSFLLAAIAAASVLSASAQAAAIPADDPVLVESASAYGELVLARSRGWSDLFSRLAAIVQLDPPKELHALALDEKHLEHALDRGAKPEKILKQADRLLAEWDQQLRDLVRYLSRGIYNRLGDTADRAGASLVEGGVSPEPPAPLVLLAEQMRAYAEIGDPPSLRNGRFQLILNQALAGMMSWARGVLARHPEHGPAVMAAVTQLQRGVLFTLDAFRFLDATLIRYAVQRRQLRDLRPRG